MPSSNTNMIELPYNILKYLKQNNEKQEEIKRVL